MNTTFQQAIASLQAHLAKEEDLQGQGRTIVDDRRKVYVGKSGIEVSDASENILELKIFGPGR